MNEIPDRLLATDEPPPFTVDNPGGGSPLLIVADHAGKHFPGRLKQLGVSDTECERHIAWDIGIAAVSRLIGQALGAVVIRQNYSRLVIDCNRTPGSDTSIAELSELTTVPGNIGLSERDKLARVREIFQPYHRRIANELDRRREAARPTALISLHSFTPVFKTETRPWHVGVLYNRDRRFAQILMELLHREDGLVVGDNEPYSVTDASDYTIPVHGEQRRLHHVALEIRQDLIMEEAGQRTWAALFARLLSHAYQRLAWPSKPGEQQPRRGGAGRTISAEPACARVPRSVPW
jgi:predicted N-formylglutamate amidohydrolase